MFDRALQERLLETVASFAPAKFSDQGASTTVPRLTVWSSAIPTAPAPGLFSPMFYVVLSGTKILTLGHNRFELPAGTCLASSFGLPYVSELSGATPERPYVGLRLDLDPSLLASVMLDMPPVEEQWTCAAAQGALEGDLAEIFGRFVGLMNVPDDIAMLAAAYERELYYRLLKSSMGNTLRQVGQGNNRLRQIKAIADRLAADPSATTAIPDLAAAAGMSITSFHRHFKAMIGHSPLAFQRQVRLIEARKLLVAGQATVSEVAYEVGYVSASQFSREYKSMFGSSPVTDLPPRGP